MHAFSTSRLLALLIPLGLAIPAAAEMAEEEMTDELPDWMEVGAELWALEVEPDAGYGADIPSPEEVVRGGAAPVAPAQQTAPTAVSAEEREIGIEDFREGLAPYGRWVNTPEYGTVFVPSSSVQVAGWRPYLHGQWVWTRYGWTWVSDEPFGWATYHYGRWGHRVGLGWFWVPGFTWGPAWVAWRHGPDAIGWAPLYPGHVRVTASYPIHVDHWVFVGHSHFHAHPIHRHWYRDRHHHHFHRSHWARNWRSSGRVYVGPPRTFVERRGGRVREVGIVRAGRPAPSRLVSSEGRRRVEIYRPAPRASTRRGAVAPPRRPAPQRVERRGNSAPTRREAARRPSSTRQVEPRSSGRSAVDRSMGPRRERPQASPRAQRRRESAPPSNSRMTPSPRREATPPARVQSRGRSEPTPRGRSGEVRRAAPPSRQREARPSRVGRPPASRGQQGSVASPRNTGSRRSIGAPAREQRGARVGSSNSARSNRNDPRVRAPSRSSSKPSPAKRPSGRRSSSGR